MIINACKGDGGRQEVQPQGYHWDESKSRQLILGRLKDIMWDETFQFLDNTCFYGRLSYTLHSAATYGFHIKLNLLGIFFLIQYPAAFDITCEVFLDRFVLPLSSNINFPFLFFSVNLNAILTTLELGLTPRDQLQSHFGWTNSRSWACYLLAEVNKYKGNKNKRKRIYWLKDIFPKIKHWTQFWRLNTANSS